jgi:hypothetical protein
MWHLLPLARGVENKSGFSPVRDEKPLISRGATLFEPA